MIAALWKEENKKQGERTDLTSARCRAEVKDASPTRSEATKLFNVSRRKIDKATYVQKRNPELAEKVHKGEIALSNAYRQAKAPEEKMNIPDDLFGDIIGHDEVKELLRACLLAEKPVHVLLAGPPALAKTLFLWDIERVSGERAIWLVGSATSKAGLWDVVADRQPSIVLIDELDKMNAADTAALLSMMEGDRLVRAKVGRELNLQHEIRVVAATNRVHMLSPELKSRFAIREMHPYSRDEYLVVVKGVLMRRDGAAPELAEEIAKRLDGRSQDVRDAVRVVRLAPQLGVEKAVKLLLGE